METPKQVVDHRNTETGCGSQKHRNRSVDHGKTKIAQLKVAVVTVTEVERCKEEVESEQRPITLSGRTSVRYRFGSPFSSKRWWFVDTVL